MRTARANARIAALLLSALPVSIVALSADASRRRASRDRANAAIEAVARILPSNDLSLSGGARWLRSPSMEEPAAAFQDGPALPDPDPAGGSMAPPVAVWSAAVR